MNVITVYNYWKRLLPHHDVDALNFVIQKGTIKHFKKNDLIKLADEPLPYLFVVLEGYVGGYQLNDQQDLVLVELVLPKDYFNGTKHPFSKSATRTEYRALTSVIIFQLHHLHAQEGQKRFPDISEVFHIQKQRKINFLNIHVFLLQEQNLSKRYHRFRKVLPMLALELPQYIQCQLLQTSSAHLRRIKKLWMKS